MAGWVWAALAFVLDHIVAVVAGGALMWLATWARQFVQARRPAARIFAPSFERGRRIEIVLPEFDKSQGSDIVMEKTSGRAVAHPRLPIVDFLDMGAALAVQAILLKGGKAEDEVTIRTTHQRREARKSGNGHFEGLVLIGAGSNPETMRLNDGQNLLFRFEHRESPVWIPEDAVLRFGRRPDALTWRRERGLDYAVIQRVQTPDGVRIVVAGLGAAGTRAAGDYLARHWRRISRAFGTSEFGIVIAASHDETQADVIGTSLAYWATRDPGGHVASGETHPLLSA